MVEIANAILRNWRVMMLLPITLALVVGIWAFSQSRMYAATATFLPQGSEGRTAGGAASLAQQFGVNLTAERPGQSPQFYVELLRSQAVLRAAVETEYRTVLSDGSVRQATLIERFDLSGDGGTPPPWRKATDRLKGNMAVSVARETGVVHLTVSAPDPALAEQVAARVLELVNTFNTEVRQGRAKEETRFIGSRLVEVYADLLAAEGALQEFLRQNREFRNAPELAFEHDRLQRQVAMQQEVYTSLLRAQENARIDAVRDTPLFTVIDHPAGTAEPQGRGTVLRMLAAFAIGLVLAFGVAIVRELTRRSREAGDPHYREFQGLARQTWDDFRRPVRWVRPGRKAVPSEE
jgi:uncharacterized protein involved in exopolysaccharide biosynthesis